MNAVLQSEALAREAVFFASLLAVLLLSAILILVLRTRALPTCWECGYHSMRRSESHRIIDTLARGCFLYPYRCEKCLQRRYCFRFRRLSRHSGGRSMATGRRPMATGRR
jgi:hypothetical protein